MELALAEAKNSGEDVPVGCVVIFDGKIIGRGRNQREQLHDPTAHAEIVAMREAALSRSSWRLDGTILCVTLEPCPMCAEAIIQSRVKTVIFGAYDLIYGATGSAFNLFTPNRTFPIPEIVGGIAEQQCKSLLQEFFKRQRETKR